MIGATQAIGRAAAAAKMHDYTLPAALARRRPQRTRIRTCRAAFKAVEEHDEWLRVIVVRRGPVEIDEIAIRGVPALATKLHSHARREQSRVERLQMAARQPRGRAIG